MLPTYVYIKTSLLQEKTNKLARRIVHRAPCKCNGPRPCNWYTARPKLSWSLCVSYGSAHSHWRRLSYLRAQMPIFPTTVDGPLSGLLPRATASSRCAAPASRRSESSRGTMKEAAIEKLKTVNGRRKSTIIIFFTYFFLPSLPSSVRRPS